jgi:hypothetical protein
MTRRALLAGLAALVMAGCGGGGGKPEKPPEDPGLSREAQQAIDELDANARPHDAADDIEQLLRERATALEAEDILALEATATGRQRAGDRRSARRAKQLLIERIRYAVDDLQIDGAAATARVGMSYRVRGMPRPFVTPRKLTLRRESVGWRVAADKPAGEPLPWEIAAFRATRTPHVVLLTPPGVGSGALRRGLERAYREVSRGPWPSMTRDEASGRGRIRRDLPGRALPRRVLVVATAGTRMTEQLSGRLARGVVAIANVSVAYRPGPARQVGRVLAQRMIVVHDRWRRLPPAGRRSTLVHEMTHTALDPDTSGRTPAWLAEGVAMYVSRDDRTAEAAARAGGLGPATKLGRVSRPGSIFRLSGRAQGAAYAAASAAAYAIVARAGTKGLFRLYDAFNDSRIRGRPGAQLTDRVLRRSIGMSLDELDALVAG